MRTYLAGFALIGILSAGCSSDWDQSRAGKTAAGSEESAADKAQPTATLSSRSGTASFASLPDRGELLRYPQDREVKRAGAYTSHPVEISEAHALNAIANGVLRLSAPDGTPVEVPFERIEEHPDGNWTWVGEDGDGNSAVLTFGERSVFGEITSGGQLLRVTTRNGGAWVVETDHSQLAGTDRGGREDGPDFLIPPTTTETVGAAAMAGSRSTVLAAADSSATSKASPAVVDLALGYTDGLVAKYGSESAAVTLITSLSALTNQAYQRSGVNMRVRLVKTIRVDYADNTDNADALQELTGYNADSGQPMTPDPAFNELREARDEFGADLVSLIRPHRSPEQDGCGIAWLLGAEQSGITASDAPFGYSVVSEGDDIDEGDGFTYFCSNHSLAHELGHSMGQAHNEADSEFAGAHAYSYGYRETSTSGFYTIMAYPLADSSQFEIAHFANPAVSNAGRPTGVANSADNVRSMNLTMPIIQTFRATVVPLPTSVAAPQFDFDGDGSSDALWRHSANGQNVIWPGADRDAQLSITSVSDTGWQMVGYGDFNEDGKSDIVWRHATKGSNAIWLSADRTTQQAITTVTNAAWRIMGIGDFDGDGVSDLLWREVTSGGNAIWLSANRNTQRAVTGVSNLNWRIVGVGDFDGDGESDILWRDVVTGSNAIWLSGDRATQRSVTARTGANWEVVGVGDFNGDSQSDIFWRNRATGANDIWLSGSSATVRNVAAASAVTKLAAIGDYNGDGFSDLLWRNTANGNNVIWLSASSATSVGLPGVTDQRWRPQPRNY